MSGVLCFSVHWKIAFNHFKKYLFGIFTTIFLQEKLFIPTIAIFFDFRFMFYEPARVHILKDGHEEKYNICNIYNTK